LKVSNQTVKAAFQRHYDVYARKKNWNIPNHVRQWNTARRAFEGRSFSDFSQLYEELRRRWQIFRGVKARPTAQSVYDTLLGLDSDYQSKRLSRLMMSDAVKVWDVVSAVSNVKRRRGGPSVVAASKFLHFWNPCLFVIVDDAMIWKWVFGHSWLWDCVESKYEEVKRALPSNVLNDHDFNTDLGYYLPILLWASDVVRENSFIAEEFDRYVRGHFENSQPPENLVEYEAAAIEWFLLGLVELPPKGIQL